MKDYFLRLYAYNQWANERYFSVCKELPHVPERIHLLFSHVVAAQQLWLKRILGEEDIASIHIWKTIPWEELHILSRETHLRWMNYLEDITENELNRLLSYVNFQQKPYKTVISDIIIHTANHATYHRAQFAISLREQHIDPPNTDFITFSRELSHQL